MLKRTMKLGALAAALVLAAPAQAMTFQIGVEVTFAAGSNPFGAVVGTTAAGGTGETGSQVVTGVGQESLSMNPAFDAAASMALTIGMILFGHEDDIESVCCNDVPSLDFLNGVFEGLDFVALFTILGTSAIGETFDEKDLAQDTTPFEDGNHYWADFEDDGSFVVGLIVGFFPASDPEEGDFLDPDLDLLVAGNVFLPEPSLAVLAGMSLVGLAVMRHR